MARTRRPQPKKYTVAIVGDGQTERIYFADVRDTDRPDNLTILPQQPRTIGNYEGVLDRATALVEDYDCVYALIDMDKILQDKQDNTYEAAKTKALKAGVIVLENNPCFEMWILLHFENTARAFNDCASVEKRIRDHYIANYDKSQRFLVSKRLYHSYKDRIQSHAIPNSALLERDRAEKSKFFPRAEIYKFFDWYLNR
jgi:hypothetical protein